MGEHKVRHKTTGKIEYVSVHTFKHLHWTDFEKINEPAKPEVKEPVKTEPEAKEESEPTQEPEDETVYKTQEYLETLNVKQLKAQAKDLEGFKTTLNKAELIELIKNS